LRSKIIFVNHCLKFNDSVKAVITVFKQCLQYIINTISYYITNFIQYDKKYDTIYAYYIVEK